jgi:hypothetical protein
VDSCANTHGEHIKKAATADVMRALNIQTSENQNNNTRQDTLGADVKRISERGRPARG